MFKEWMRIILLTLAILVLDNCNIINQFKSIAYASDDISPMVGGKADHPSCESAGLMTAIIGGVITIIATYYAGKALMLSVVGAKVGAAMVVSATGALAALISANVEFFACTHSFVRHPVLRWDNNGKYKKCKNPEPLFPGDTKSGMVCKSQEYEDTSDYKWPENKAPYSDYIEICNRVPIGGIAPSLDAREKDFGFKGDFKNDEEKTKGDAIVDMKKAFAWYDISCAAIKAGDSTVLNSITFQAREDGGRICVDAVGSFGGSFWTQAVRIGCHARAPSPPAPMCEKSVPKEWDSIGRVTKYDNSQCFNCYISGACYSQVSLAARAPFPITSVVIQCIKESLTNLVSGECSTASGQNSSKNESFLGAVQKRLKSTVTAVLVLAIALFGIKMMMGHAIQGPHEYFMLLIKVALVIYFSIGNGMQVYYDQLIKLSLGLSDLVLSAGGSDQVCNYKTSDYVRDLGNGQKDYSYLAPWDRLDCRIGFYLGNGFVIGGATAAGAAVAAAILPVFGVLFLIIPALFAGQVLIAICVAFFVFMLLLTVIWVVHLFILSLLALTIVSVFAPVFVPMVLFQATKGFFDGWVKQLMAYSIYPIILFAFLALVFSVFDKLYFDDLKFTSGTKNKDVGNGKKRLIEYFIPDYKGCNNNPNIIACIVANIKPTEGTLILGIKITKAEFDRGGTEKIWKNFGMMGLMGFLFYHFLGVIGGMAAELSGSFRADLSGGASSPKDMAAKVEAGAMKVTSGIGRAMRGLGSSVSDKMSGGKSTDGGSERLSSNSGSEGSNESKSRGVSGGSDSKPS